MKNTVEYKSRFRILKGGKISLVVSALLVGSLVNVTDANATSINIGSQTTKEHYILSQDTTITVNGDLNVTGSDALVVTSNDYIIDIDVTSEGSVRTYDGSTSAGIRITDSMGSDSSIVNSGTLEAKESLISAYSEKAHGIYVANGMKGDITNNAIISAESAANAYGISINGADGLEGAILNNKDANITAISGSDSAFGIYAKGMKSDSTIQNIGTIEAKAYAGDIIYKEGVDAYGIQITGDMNGTITNSENATISAISELKDAFGIRTGSMKSDSTMLNSGSISATSVSGSANGIDLSDMKDNSSITNSKNISATSISGKAQGIYASGMHGDASIINNNGASINAVSTSKAAYGIYISCSYNNDNSSITNIGDIYATSTSGKAVGIYAYEMDDNSTITNSGNIIVSSGEDKAYGIETDMDNDSNITNSGTIIVSSTHNKTYGIKTDMYSNSSITNSGKIIVSSDHNKTYGIKTDMNDESSITNSGTITATINDVADKDAFSLYLDHEEEEGHVDSPPIRGVSSEPTITNKGILDGNIYVGKSISMSNAGLISLPSNANYVNSDSAAPAYIANFTNESTGTLEVGLNTGSDGSVTNSFSQLYTQKAVFKSGSTISVNVQTDLADQALLVDKKLSNVVRTSDLTIEGTLNIEDNSALLDFEYSTTNALGDASWGGNGEHGAIHLSVVEGSSILEATIDGKGEIDTQGAASALDTIKDSDNTKMNEVFTELNGLPTNEAVAAAVESTTPQSTTASSGAGAQIMSGMQGIVEMRQNVNVGMNSGDSLFSGRNVWIKPYISYGSQDNKDGINGFGVRAKGFGLGVDGEYASNQNIGIAFFYTKADVDVNNVVQSSDLDVFSTLLYGNVPVMDGETNFLYQLGYAWQKTTSQRKVFNGDVAKSDYTSTTAAVDLKLMRDVKASDSLLLQPMLQATYRYLSNPSYTETGADTLNLHSESFTDDDLITSLGAIGHYSINEDSKIIANVNVGYNFKDGASTVTSAYAGAIGTTFETNGIDNGKWNYELGAGYEMQNILGGELNFMYNYQAVGTNFRNNTLSAKYVIAF